MTTAAMLYRVPVLGWFLRDAVEGLPDAKYFFAFNVVVTLALLLWFVGYPVAIGLGLAGTAAAFFVLIALTATDLIDNARRKLGR